jgi:D-alanyl-lipoteichoic acid acyltransferase DltB (MBOAT superfamily)
MSLAEMEVFSLFHLVFIWYKFLIIWKTARLWSKIYGVEVIDNMSRCIFNNYGFEGFWRMWHRGFNHWLIRYLYVPLGGKSNILSVLAVVSFVSFWHDHTINIVFWGLIIALFMIPEIMIKKYFRKYKRHWYNTYWLKYVAGFVSSIYIHFLIICNCIGFGYGVGQMELVLEKIQNEYQTIIGSIFIVMIPTLCMFHIRNLEGNMKNY